MSKSDAIDDDFFQEHYNSIIIIIENFLKIINCQPPYNVELNLFYDPTYLHCLDVILNGVSIGDVEIEFKNSHDKDIIEFLSSRIDIDSAFALTLNNQYIVKKDHCCSHISFELNKIKEYYYYTIDYLMKEKINESIFKIYIDPKNNIINNIKIENILSEDIINIRGLNRHLNSLHIELWLIHQNNPSLYNELFPPFDFCMDINAIENLDDKLKICNYYYI